MATMTTTFFEEPDAETTHACAFVVIKQKVVLFPVITLALPL